MSLKVEMLCSFTGQLTHVAVAFLWDHIVAGRSILPGAAVMEFAAASGSALADSLLTTSNAKLGLDAATIPAAVILTASPATGPSLESRVDTKAGSLEIASYAKGKTQSETPPETLSITQIHWKLS